VKAFRLFPSASPITGVLALGGMVGLAIAMALLRMGLIRQSYPQEESEPVDGQTDSATVHAIPEEEDDQFNHRGEILKELVFLAPVIVGAAAALMVYRHIPAAHRHWDSVMACPMAAGFIGSLWGYLIGCGTVWITRVLGTLAFGREAMGLGDVHLMGAAGAVIGAEMAVVAFFVAPFFGLIWASYQWVFKKTRQIPYGPFLSMAVGLVMIASDWFWNYWSRLCGSWRMP
jgi:leader peptidase (prepilin peptidase)/N-methyltransferase